MSGRRTFRQAACLALMLSTAAGQNTIERCTVSDSMCVYGQRNFCGIVGAYTAVGAPITDGKKSYSAFKSDFKPHKFLFYDKPLSTWAMGGSLYRPPLDAIARSTSTNVSSTDGMWKWAVFGEQDRLPTLKINCWKALYFPTVKPTTVAPGTVTPPPTPHALGKVVFPGVPKQQLVWWPAARAKADACLPGTLRAHDGDTVSLSFFVESRPFHNTTVVPYIGSHGAPVTITQLKLKTKKRSHTTPLHLPGSTESDPLADATRAMLLGVCASDGENMETSTTAFAAIHAEQGAAPTPAPGADDDGADVKHTVRSNLKQASAAQTVSNHCVRSRQWRCALVVRELL